MHKRSPFKIALQLIGLIKPMLLVMFLAIILGVLGNLGATFITIVGGYGLLEVFQIDTFLTIQNVFIILLVLAITRGILRYGEQACNHYIAFKILANIRVQVFEVLRKLAPAKLEGKNSGDLISLITSDVELLEVFYAHTISPIAIAFITSIIMTLYISYLHPVLGIVALLFYSIIGIIIPIINSKIGKDTGHDYRQQFGKLNTVVLDSLYGIKEITQYHQSNNTVNKIDQQTKILKKHGKLLTKYETIQKCISDSAVLLAGAVMLCASYYLYLKGTITFVEAFLAVIAMLSSFGPVMALSVLSNTLQHTLASGNRVLDLLIEKPIVKEVIAGHEFENGDITLEDVTFGYDQKEIIKDFNTTFTSQKVHGIYGPSGGGKSTLLKLLMRFYTTKSGDISYHKQSINQINSHSLKENISYVSQDTFLFNDSIENNIRLAKPNATMQEIIVASKKASIHEDIEALPNSYDTLVGESGSKLSGGQKQRIALARSFLHDSNYIFFDEPTSNIDSLNEAVILKSIDQEKDDKTILLVSHKKSSLAICDTTLKI